MKLFTMIRILRNAALLVAKMARLRDTDVAGSAAFETTLAAVQALLDGVGGAPQHATAPVAVQTPDHDPCPTCAALKGQIRGLCEAWQIPISDRWQALLDGMGHAALNLVIINLREDRILWPEGEPVPQMERPPQFYDEIFRAAQDFGVERRQRVRAFEREAMPSDAELEQQVRRRAPGMLPEVCSPDLMRRLQRAFLIGAFRPGGPASLSQA